MIMRPTTEEQPSMAVALWLVVGVLALILFVLQVSGV